MYGYNYIELQMACEKILHKMERIERRNPNYKDDEKWKALSKRLSETHATMKSIRDKWKS